MDKKKKLLVFGLPILLLVGIGSAVLLDYFGQIQTNVDVKQAITLSGEDCGNNVCIDNVEQVYSPDIRLSGLYVLTNDDPKNSRDVELVTTYSQEIEVGEITTTYVKPIAKDDNTEFGSRNNEVVVIEPETSLTLNSLFSGNGIKYEYSVLNGGTYNGASPAIVVIDLSDGRHIVLFPGWGDRTGTYTLQFSDTVALDTGGNHYVDSIVYGSNWIKTEQSPVSYPAWTALNAALTTVDGTEVVTRIAIQHQAANTGQEDQVESMLVNGVDYVFIDGISGDKFIVSSLNPKLGFIVKNEFNTDEFDGTIITSINPTQ